jgi:hypothetical protein
MGPNDRDPGADAPLVLEQHIEAGIAQGLTPTEARARAVVPWTTFNR